MGEECSGLRQLVGFLAFAVLLGLMLDRPTWHRVLLVALAVPFAVLANVLRVLLMSFGAIRFGTEWMNGWLHHAPAGFTIPVGFALLIGVDYLLGRRTVLPKPTQSTGERSWSLAVRLRPVAICLGLTIVLQVALKIHLQAAGADSFPGMAASLRVLPEQFTFNDGGSNRVWNGHDRPELTELQARLPYAADDLLLRDYQLQGSGLVVQLYLAYSRIGEDRKHHPEICIREVTGAPEDLSARQLISLDPEQRRQVQRFVFLTGTTGRTAVYYWHYTLLPASTNNTFLQTIHQRLGQTPPSLTVQVSVNSAHQADLKAIEASFLPALDAALRHEQLPASAVIGATRLPVALLRE
ncbi:MAG: exosortase-associated EpsI family protein [Planctomycetes bacterium]|nr:exosortase-associated EpsI family protein [Planctomycetota bacterium]